LFRSPRLRVPLMLPLLPFPLILLLYGLLYGLFGSFGLLGLGTLGLFGMFGVLGLLGTPGFGFCDPGAGCCVGGTPFGVVAPAPVELPGDAVEPAGAPAAPPAAPAPPGAALQIMARPAVVIVTNSIFVFIFLNQHQRCHHSLRINAWDKAFLLTNKKIKGHFATSAFGVMCICPAARTASGPCGRPPMQLAKLQRSTGAVRT
jgi:hypothetical protein